MPISGTKSLAVYDLWTTGVDTDSTYQNSDALHWRTGENERIAVVYNSGTGTSVATYRVETTPDPAIGYFSLDDGSAATWNASGQSVGGVSGGWHWQTISSPWPYVRLGVTAKTSGTNTKIYGWLIGGD